MLTAGVDTWSICWYLPQDSRGRKAMDALATQRTRRGYLVEDLVAGHRIGWFPGSRMLYAEGHPVEDRLAGFSELPAAAQRVYESLNEVGVFPPSWRFAPLTDKDGAVLKYVGDSGFGGVRRLDTTVDLQGSSSVGRAIMSGVAAVEAPGQLRSDVYRSKRGRAIETVVWEGAAGKVGRIYDKGVESGSHSAGERIRFEDQRRFSKGARPTLEAVIDGYGQMLFRRRFEPLRQATKGIVVTTQEQLLDQLVELVEEGEMTPSQADRMVGQLLFEAGGYELGSRTTRWRRRKRVAEAGLLLSDGLVDEVRVDLGEELKDVFEVSFER